MKIYIQASISENEHQYYPTYSDVFDFISTQFKKDLLSDTIRHIIRNNFFRIFRVVDGKPMDINRIDVPLSEIEDNLYELNQKIAGIPPRFVFNLNEMGCEEFADAREVKVIVPFNFHGNSAPYPVCRRKRNSILFCISANGFDCPPQFAVKRFAIENELYEYIPKNKIQVVNTKKGFITTKSFLLWLNEVFLPFLHNEKEITGYQDQSVLILDDYLQ